ncbi:hypothetical protein L2734_16615 [Parashewanella spongiae]|uniref:hypothetical protein n=1 Tax=Parashewanella spongiae TaxID=342950 RepID=UPI00105A1CE8|nr:hypothetical protein [Parashewanella spongiae]MCL1079764.1 hypothetical protein [Parashewanella spongiae]
MASIASNISTAENISLQVWLNPIEGETNTIAIGDHTYTYFPNDNKSWFNLNEWVIKFHSSELDSEITADTKVPKSVKKEIALIEAVFEREGVKHESYSELVSKGRITIVTKQEYIPPLKKNKQHGDTDTKAQQTNTVSEALATTTRKKNSSQMNELSATKDDDYSLCQITTIPKIIHKNWSNINVFIQSQRGERMKLVVEHLSQIPYVPDHISMTRPHQLFGFSIKKLPEKPRYYCPITFLPLSSINAIQVKTLNAVSRKEVWKTVSRTGARHIIFSEPENMDTRDFLFHKNELTASDFRAVTSDNLTLDSVLTEVPKRNDSMPILSE